MWCLSLPILSPTPVISYLLSQLLTIILSFFQFVEVFLLTLIFLVLVVSRCMIKLTLSLLTSSFLPYLGTLYSLIHLSKSLLKSKTKSLHSITMIFLLPLLMPKPTSLITFLLRVLILVQALLYVCHSLTFSDPPPDLLCTPEQVLHLIHQLQTDTSSGPDSISSKMLKSTAYSISHPLSLLFNQSISFGTFPSEWKCSHITPILKSTSPSSPSCYRPISLLSLVSKLLEKHISL